MMVEGKAMTWEEDDFDGAAEEEFVPAVFARSMEEAEEFQQLLEDHGIEAVLGTEEELEDQGDPDTTVGSIAHGVAVLVPEMYLDEASEIIADREDTDEFEDEDEEDQDDEDDEFPLGGEEGEEGYFQLEDDDEILEIEDDEDEQFDLGEDDDEY